MIINACDIEAVKILNSDKIKKFTTAELCQSFINMCEEATATMPLCNNLIQKELHARHSEILLNWDFVKLAEHTVCMKMIENNDAASFRWNEGENAKVSTPAMSFKQKMADPRYRGGFYY